MTKTLCNKKNTKINNRKIKRKVTSEKKDYTLAVQALKLLRRN